MSIGSPHRRPNRKQEDELARLTTTTSFQAMWTRPFRVDTSKEIPDSAGYNVAGTVYYIDSALAAAIRAGKIVVPGLMPQQILGFILLHERVEKCLLDSDAGIDAYQEAHEFATLAEHQAVRAAGATPRLYEEALRPYIKHNETKPLADVPLDLDAEPYVDHPDTDDRRAIAQMVKLGVADAGKASKESLKYGKATGAERCGRCANWVGPPQAELAECRVISGAVRGDRWCSMFVTKGAAQ